MGCLLRIVDIIELLKGDTGDRYQLKLTIIENCVYGVDIQPIAMLICKLRFFISLICEQNDIDFSSPETTFGINTLPNLETKFVAANTLISANIRNYEDDWTNDEKPTTWAPWTTWWPRRKSWRRARPDERFSRTGPGLGHRLL